MNLKDVIPKIQAAHLNDDAERLILADLFDEAGRAREAALLRGPRGVVLFSGTLHEEPERVRFQSRDHHRLHGGVRDWFVKAEEVLGHHLLTANVCEGEPLVLPHWQFNERSGYLRRRPSQFVFPEETVAAIAYKAAEMANGRWGSLNARAALAPNLPSDKQKKEAEFLYEMAAYFGLGHRVQRGYARA